MTVREVIERAQTLFPDVLSFAVKKARLRELDGRIYSEFLSNFEDTEHMKPIDEYEPDTALLLPDEFSEVYVRYLCLQADIENGDTVRYANSSALFNSAYLSFMTYYNRNHKVKQIRINI